eukprot:EG_transcript_18587
MDGDGLSVEQSEELDALRAIYPDELRVNNNSFTISIPLKSEHGEEDPRGSFELSCTFVPGYPSARGPQVRVDAPWMSGPQASTVEEDVRRLAEENRGDPMMFTIIEHLKQNNWWLLPSAAPDPHPTRRPRVRPHSPDEARFQHIEIHTGEPITDRKSTFQAFCAQVHSVEEVQYVLRALRRDANIAAAAHPAIHAFRFQDSQGRLQESLDDDGETGAAERLLYLLQVGDARDVLVVVTRWFGGILLGPDRFRHISNVAKDLLQQQRHINQKGGGSSAKSAKGKSKE